MAKVGTTLCQTLAGSLPEKSSEKRSSFLAAMGLEGTLGRSAAFRLPARRAKNVNERMIMRKKGG